MARLTWFISLPGFALMVLGLRSWRCAAGTRRCGRSSCRRCVLFPLYGYTASNSTRLLWWTRRYVPTVLPGIVVLLALAIAFFVVWRFRGRLLTAVPAVAALAGLVAFFLSQSLPAAGARRVEGSFALTQEIADLSEGREGVYLWEFDQGCCAAATQLLATPVWLQHGQLSGLLAQRRQHDDRRQRARDVIDRTAARSRPAAVRRRRQGQLPRASTRPRRAGAGQEDAPCGRRHLERPTPEAREIPVHVSVVAGPADRSARRAPLTYLVLASGAPAASGR
jgi:hypothetical protein